jgi:hypothetical protein
MMCYRYLWDHIDRERKPDRPNGDRETTRPRGTRQERSVYSSLIPYSSPFPSLSPLVCRSSSTTIPSFSVKLKLIDTRMWSWRHNIDRGLNPDITQEIPASPAFLLSGRSRSIDPTLSRPSRRATSSSTEDLTSELTCQVGRLRIESFRLGRATRRLAEARGRTSQHSTAPLSVHV